MGSFYKKKKGLSEEACPYIFGEGEPVFQGDRAYLVNKHIEYFSNDELDCLLRDKNGELIERSIGTNKKKWRLHGGFTQ